MFDVFTEFLRGLGAPGESAAEAPAAVDGSGDTPLSGAPPGGKASPGGPDQGGPGTELAIGERGFTALSREEIDALSPEEQERYFDAEEQYLHEYWNEQQGARVNELGVETYSATYPEDADRYLGPE